MAALRMFPALLSIVILFLQSASSQDTVSPPDSLTPCPTCYTSTIYIAPPCAPWHTCTGSSTPPPTGCTRTVDLRPTTFTVPGLNPACPVTPTVTDNLGCPSQPACYQALCSTVVLGPPGDDAEITEPPMECVATTTYTIPSPTTPSFSFDTTRTPPPFPSFPPDEEDE
ncbi:hypothetical protein B0T14DRAFT_568305 [Immersiella caudata]|uniref:Uncharacterized protein n=1 Tax=Immersiella caudata TaxID=314043 RepID=A0AA39WJW5_9PEZI|nr:hypothetical protein B0T14DRAFT_568305 [Immersiella caudata]